VTENSKHPVILFTGGGSAGHVAPNVPLIQRFQQNKWHVVYIGSGIILERQLIEPLGVTYHDIHTGKFRRYLSWNNFIDVFRILVGIVQAFVLINRLEPKVAFSKGGYVAFPVVVAAWLNRIPVIAHESDVTPGLANRLSYPFVKKVCTSFKDTLKYISGKRGIHTGTPIRTGLLQGDPERARTNLNLSAFKPTLLLLGGSQGSHRLNTLIRSALPTLVTSFNVIHQCGKNNLDSTLSCYQDYRQVEFLSEDQLADTYALADAAISRAGASSLVELLSLKLPHILIPLEAASRGEQIENAEMATKKGWSLVLRESTITTRLLIDTVTELYKNRNSWQSRISCFACPESTEEIEALLLSIAKK